MKFLHEGIRVFTWKRPFFKSDALLFFRWIPHDSSIVTDPNSLLPIWLLLNYSRPLRIFMRPWIVSRCNNNAHISIGPHNCN
eukprot:2591199-Prorocentrum_lima.AAC.1